MAKIQHPWQTGPTELIEFALDRMHKGSDFDRRLAFLMLDVGVETLFKTFLTLPESVVRFKIQRGERFKASQGNFHELLHGIEASDPNRAAIFNFAHIEYYHNFRNVLYHQGNQVIAVQLEQLRGYANLAVNLLREYLDVDLTELLIPQKSGNQTTDSDDPVIDSVEVKVSFGRFRLERLMSQAIRVLSLDTNTFEAPVKPLLRAFIEEMSLPVELTFKSGTEKDTRALGKDVIDELRPSSWHGLVAGQKVRKDALVAMLTSRIREGKADEKNSAKVDFVRKLKYDVLVYQPLGAGFGNSPFNMNCWFTEDGDPIKQE